ncbi:MAG: hypothetical protein QOG09_1831 [Solirubrobacterales bacterium]|nr:hypothetical protein [Solirubrobacterales bacterium]
MTHREHDQDWSEQIAGYALGALEADQAQAVERHLAECERCERDLRWLQPAVDLIPASVDQQKAPKRVRGRVMSEVRAEARRERGPSRWAWLSVRPSAALAGALAGMLLAAVVAGYLVRGPGGQRASTVAVRAVPGELHGTQVSLVRRGDSAVLVARGLPARPGGQVYEAWLRRGSAIEPSSVFVPDRNGVATVAISGHVRGADELMVTREPRGGSAAPGSAPILRAPLSAS